MNDHPIQGLMVTAMQSIKEMVDVNTIIGEAIMSGNTTIIPISKVSFGFAAGGSEFKGETVNGYSKRENVEEVHYKLPFGGGSGAGVSINPIAFLVVQNDKVRLLPVDHDTSLDKLIDYIPDISDRLNNMFNTIVNKKKQDKSEQDDIEN